MSWVFRFLRFRALAVFTKTIIVAEKYKVINGTTSDRHNLVLTAGGVWQ